MFAGNTIKVVVPALNEAGSIGKVLSAIPGWVDEIVVVDNGSTDGTAELAARAGARVVTEPRRGYGRACLTGLRECGGCEIVVFLDADFSDYPEEMDRLVVPIAEDRADLVVGSRVRGGCPAGALSTAQRFGTALACRLMNTLWRTKFSDLGPFRAVRMSALRAIRMSDPTYGWTIEMQIKAARASLRCVEVPVSYRKRIGRSKISGTLRGVLGAGTKILWTVSRHALLPPPVHPLRSERLIVFTRYPIPGRTKTRLIPAVGPLAAARIQQWMTRHVLDEVVPLGDREGVDIELRYTGTDLRTVRRWLGMSLHLAPQGAGDLGRRMANAFRNAFNVGCRRAVIIGTDCPAVSKAHILAAYNALADYDVVLGPGTDGGYWLIGLRGLADIFRGIEWGTQSVLEQTLERAKRQHLKVHLLEQLSDIDRPEDLQHLPAGIVKDNPYISVIIPALNEAAAIEAAVASAQCDEAEVIVVDGGSEDKTIPRAMATGAQVLRSPQRGRGRQMNLAARHAKGQVLLFLHADTLLPPRFAGLVFDTLLDPQVVAGAFEHSIDVKTWTMSAVSRLVNLRSGYLKLPYGDQGIFVRRSVFDEMGGFEEAPIAEDLQLMRRLRRWGRIAIAAAPAVTSARRWRRLGVIRTTLANQLVVGGFLLGLPPHVLRGLYTRAT